MGEETADKKARKMTARRYVVVRVDQDNPDELTVKATVADGLAAAKWATEHGHPDEVYQRAQLIGDPMRVTVEPIEKRTLVP